MENHCAPPERASPETLAAQIEMVSTNPVVTGLLHFVNGSLAVLNENRQVLAVNEAFLRTLGVEDPAGLLGLRPGEVLGCVHADGEPAGCGTTPFCPTCGAAVAIVASLGMDKPAERLCALELRRGDRTVNRVFLVRAHPLRIREARLILLFLQDITLRYERASLERALFHDINNTLSVLLCASEMLDIGGSPERYAKMVRQAALRLKKELEIQRCLLQSDQYTYHPLHQRITVAQVFEELRSFFRDHPAARGRALELGEPPGLTLHTDAALLLRVLCHMVLNALEASQPGDTVKVWAEGRPDSVSFSVWNRKPIPSPVARRVFQRNFSTKEGEGRGIGTYFMKRFGEEVLGGRVEFRTSDREGTVFTFTLPAG